MTSSPTSELPAPAPGHRGRRTAVRGHPQRPVRRGAELPAEPDTPAGKPLDQLTFNRMTGLAGAGDSRNLRSVPSGGTGYRRGPTAAARGHRRTRTGRQSSRRAPLARLSGTRACRSDPVHRPDPEMHPPKRRGRVPGGSHRRSGAHDDSGVVLVGPGARVSSRNSDSSGFTATFRRRTTTLAAPPAERHLVQHRRGGADGLPAVRGERRSRSGLSCSDAQCGVVVAGPQPEHRGGSKGEQLGHRAGERRPTRRHDRHPVCQVRDLADRMRAQQDGNPVRRLLAHEVAIGHQRSGVKAIGRLVQDQQAWVAQQRRADATSPVTTRRPCSRRVRLARRAPEWP